MKKQQSYKVSAVVPVYNGESFIADTIHSLLHQKRKFDEIIVVDDGSTDNTVKIVKRFKNVKLIQSHHVERIAVRNIGWKAAKGNIIAFIDSDLELVPEWLEEVLKGFEQGYAAVVDRRAVYKPQTYIAKMNDHFFDLRFTDKYKPFTAWVVQRDVLEKLGGLDEGAIGFEDINLGDALYKDGYDIYFAKHALAYHKGEPTNFRTEMRRHFWFGSHALPYWKKRKPLKKPLRVALFTFLTVLFFINSFQALGFTLILYLYVFLKDLFYWKMHLKYLFVHPFIAVASEFAYSWGFIYSLIKGPITHARSTDAQVAKQITQ